MSGRVQPSNSEATRTNDGKSGVMTATDADRPVALVTGVGRRRGLGSAIVLALVGSGWDVATTFWREYDERTTWGADRDDNAGLDDEIRRLGARHFRVEADLSDPETPSRLFDSIEHGLGGASALIVNHTESVTSGFLDTTAESFDRHYAVNVRATWLLMREFGVRFRGQAGRGRIVSLTSDHVVGNVPYGATKAAADRVTLAAAYELAHLGITANAVNPGATDTGWMNDDHRQAAKTATPLNRAATPRDAANLVTFLCSEAGSWINGQLLYSNGGARSTIP